MTDTTLPTGSVGTEITRFNALKHGILSSYTVLPWEDANEYSALLAALVDEHAPRGPTEEHLIEELAGILWRKRRLRLAEAAAHRQGLNNAIKPYHDTVKTALVHLHGGRQIERVEDAIRATPEETADETRDLDEDEAMTAKALKVLRGDMADAYENAVAALYTSTREWWGEMLDCEPEDLNDDEEAVTPDADSLRRFIEKQLLPWYARRRMELANRPLIRAQAFGQSLDPEKLTQLARYEVHLDRKLERMLSILLRLKELRLGTVEG